MPHLVGGAVGVTLSRAEGILTLRALALHDCCALTLTAEF